MKRILCPKCDNYITFDETKYTEGQSLVFICEHCKKQFSIRIGKTKLKATRKEEVLDEQANSQDFGSVVVVENVFGYKQVHPLKEGDNVIGRRNKGTEVDVSIETADPSMDRKHCVINVKEGYDGELIYTLRDFPSLTGTFLCNELLGKKEQVRIEDGAIVTIGATTFILHTSEA
jgi:pSer/pThr/pTyr-binding forkhead associated (FHA) protein